MREFEILRASQSDWQRVRDIRLIALRESPDAFGRTHAEESLLNDDQWQARLSNPKVTHFLAMNPAHRHAIGLVVGADYVGIPHSAGLFGMWVAPECRQQRIGQRLVEAVVDWAASEHYKYVTLDVAIENRPAIALYRRCGFEATGRTHTLAPPRDHIHEAEYQRHLTTRSSNDE